MPANVSTIYSDLHTVRCAALAEADLVVGRDPHPRSTGPALVTRGAISKPCSTAA